MENHQTFWVQNLGLSAGCSSILYSFIQMICEQCWKEIWILSFSYRGRHVIIQTFTDYSLKIYGAHEHLMCAEGHRKLPLADLTNVPHWGIPSCQFLSVCPCEVSSHFKTLLSHKFHDLISFSNPKVSMASESLWSTRSCFCGPCFPRWIVS